MGDSSTAGLQLAKIASEHIAAGKSVTMIIEEFEESVDVEQVESDPPLGIVRLVTPHSDFWVAARAIIAVRSEPPRTGRARII